MLIWLRLAILCRLSMMLTCLMVMDRRLDAVVISTVRRRLTWRLDGESVVLCVTGSKVDCFSSAIGRGLSWDAMSPQLDNVPSTLPKSGGLIGSWGSICGCTRHS